MDTARAIVGGECSKFLPVVYVSAISDSRWMLTRRELEKLSFDLGGVAHVVVEPNRKFSFQLRDDSQGRNVYGGAIGLSLPQKGFVNRIYRGWNSQEKQEILRIVKASAITMRGYMPSIGWDWTELQEQSLRMQRQRDRTRLTMRETEELYEEEIANLKDRIRQLESSNVSDSAGGQQYIDSQFDVSEQLNTRIGFEVYPGEFCDRVRLAASLALKYEEQIGLDLRSKSVFSAIVKNFPKSPALFELIEDLRRATKDPGRIASELTSLMLRHGYREKSENKHVRLEAADGYAGLENITIPKTPSENRGLQNLRKQIEKCIGISVLGKEMKAEDR